MQTVNKPEHKSFRVFLSRNIDNTGLDGAYFFSRDAAEEAARHTRLMFDVEATVEPSYKEPNITFREWNESEW